MHLLECKCLDPSLDERIDDGRHKALATAAALAYRKNMAAKFPTSLFPRVRSMGMRTASNLVPLLLILGLAFARPATAIPLAKLDSSSLLDTRQVTSEPKLPDGAEDRSICQFSGDEDMYGLGIRIGYYIQWVATVFGAYFTPKIVSGAFEANAIFNIGMLAGLIFTTVSSRKNLRRSPLGF